MNLPKARKTGTTIVGLVYKDGVVLGADTRATEVKFCLINFLRRIIRRWDFFP